MAQFCGISETEIVSPDSDFEEFGNFIAQVTQSLWTQNCSDGLVDSGTAARATIDEDSCYSQPPAKRPLTTSSSRFLSDL